MLLAHTTTFIQTTSTMKRLYDRTKLSCLVVVFCFFFSCSKRVVYSEFQSVPDKMWDKQSEFLFHFDLKEASVPYNISLQLRNNAFYPYENIWIIIDTQNVDEIILQDTIEYSLADNTGKWKGNGIALFQNRFPLRTDCHFPDTGRYTLNIRHSMHDDRLRGIENIGLLIEKAEL